MSALKRAWNKLLLKEPSWTEEEYKEAKLKRKLDIFFLSCGCLGFRLQRGRDSHS